MPQYVAWFAELDKSSGASVGGKGANLAEMTRAGIPVPPGFVVTTAAFLAGRIPFPAIARIAAAVLHDRPARPIGSLADVLSADAEGRRLATACLDRFAALPTQSRDPS